jgi:DNA modification methylase
MKKKRTGTSTSSFGTAGRINHDASKFYASRLYAGLNLKNSKFEFRNSNFDIENSIPVESLNKLYCKSSEHMDELPDNSVHLMITSPPYNAAKDYDQDLSLDEYLDLLNKVWVETYRVLVPGGRACVNIANLGRKPYIPLHSYVIAQMIKVGFLMRGEIIWNKAASASPSTAWGSWMSAANPVLRDVHEYILVFSKGTFKRKKGAKENTISRDDFLEWTKSVWTFPAISAKTIGHPAPFPEELPHRLIQLYSFKGDIVLDPFVGSGTTCIVAAADERYYLGYDIHEEYLQLFNQRTTGTSRDAEAARD